MDNVKNNAYYLNKMLTDIRFLISKTQGISLSDLEKNEVLCDSVCFRLIQISENSSKVTQEYKDIHKELPWYQIKGLRNKIVHDYGSVDMNIIYETITKDIPSLCDMLENLV